MELAVSGYEFPDITDGTDSDWLVGILRGAGGPFRGSQTFTIESQELEELKTKFAQLSEDLATNFEFEPIEPYLQLQVTGDGRGKFRASCQLNAEPLLVGAALKYEIEVDKREIHRIVAGLGAVVARYPRRSRPTR